MPVSWKCAKSDSDGGAYKLGNWTSSDGESGGQYAIFTREQACKILGIDSLADQVAVLNAMVDECEDEVARDLTGWSHFYRGAGRAFGNEPVVRVYKHAVLVYQLTGLDI